MQSASSISVDFTSFADCCDAFSRLLWPSQATKFLCPHIQYIVVSPPAPFLSAQVLPSLARLSQFCEAAHASISLALAAELVVLASSSCLETAHHKMFLFGPARALQLQSSDNIHGSPSPSIFRKRRLEESMAVISEVLFALNFAPLHFSVKVGINDVTQREHILDAILNVNSAANSTHIFLWRCMLKPKPVSASNCQKHSLGLALHYRLSFIMTMTTASSSWKRKARTS
jgi:hypothetical protein